MPEEEDLVRRAQRGDREAFARLYEDHFDRIYRWVVFRVENMAQAEDITQQVFLRVLEALPSFRWRGVPFASWLFRIAQNQVIDYHRRRARRKEVPLEEEAPDREGGEMPLEAELGREELREALGQLTEAQRQAILLRFIGDLSLAETARAMGRSEGAIKSLQHAGLLALRRSLRPEK